MSVVSAVPEWLKSPEHPPARMGTPQGLGEQVPPADQVLPARQRD